MRPLVDTNVLSELVRPRPNPGVLAWAERHRRVAVSVISVEEIAYGLALRPNARVRQAMDELLRQHCEVLAVEAEIARDAGQLRGKLAAEGRSRTQADLLIAATARHHGLTLVTRNTRDFRGCALALLDPFEPGEASGSSPG